MWIARYEWDALRAQVARLERQNETHAKFLHNDHEKIKAQKKQLKAIIEETGASDVSERSGYFMPSIFGYYLGTRSSNREAKPFNLRQKIDAIMDHLNLTEQVTAETKLITKPVEKKKKGKK